MIASLFDGLNDIATEAKFVLKFGCRVASLFHRRLDVHRLLTPIPILAKTIQREIAKSFDLPDRAAMRSQGQRITRG